MDFGKQTEYRCQIAMRFPLKSKEPADITYYSHSHTWLMGFNMNSMENRRDFVQNFFTEKKWGEMNPCWGRGTRVDRYYGSLQ